MSLRPDCGSRAVETYTASELSDVGLRELLRRAEAAGLKQGIEAADKRRREQPADDSAVFRFNATGIPDGARITITGAKGYPDSLTFIWKEGRWCTCCA